MLSTVTYLEQTGPEDVKAARVPEVEVEIRRVEEIAPEFHRFLYTAVGGDWHWNGKLPWTRDQWVDWLSRPGFETWVAWVGGAPAGYISLRADGTEVEVENFGLLPAYIGRGIGGHLLTVRLQHAWTISDRHPHVDRVTRVWLSTNELDGPNALANYKARGLRPYKTSERDRPDADGPPPGPWPGADRKPSTR